MMIISIHSYEGEDPEHFLQGLTITYRTGTQDNNNNNDENDDGDDYSDDDDVDELYFTYDTYLFASFV